MSPREPSGASKNQKAVFSKTLKNQQFLKVFGSGGLPREPQETQEGSQEEPKELQNPQQKDQKLSPKINNFWINFGQFFGIKHAHKITQEKNNIKKQEICFFYKAKFATCDPILIHFWNPKWTSIFAQNSKKICKRNQDEPKRAIMSFKEPNNCL